MVLYRWGAVRRAGSDAPSVSPGWLESNQEQCDVAEDSRCSPVATMRGGPKHATTLSGRG